MRNSIKFMNNILKDEKNLVIITSGRDKETLSYGSVMNGDSVLLPNMVFGIKSMATGTCMEAIDKNWIEIVKPILDFYVDRTPRSFIEEKNYSLVWHYRDSDPDLGVQRAYELKDELQSLVTNLNLEIMDGDKVIEIKNSGINKGRAAIARMGNKHFDFIMAMGDDWTDELRLNRFRRKLSRSKWVKNPPRLNISWIITKISEIFLKP